MVHRRVWSEQLYSKLLVRLLTIRNMAHSIETNRNPVVALDDGRGGYVVESSMRTYPDGGFRGTVLYGQNGVLISARTKILGWLFCS